MPAASMDADRDDIDQGVTTEVVLQMCCMAMACMLLFLQVRPQHCIGRPPRINLRA